MLGSFSLQLKFHLHRGPIGLHWITLLSFLQSTDNSQDRKICLAHFLIVHLLSFISQPSAAQRLCIYFSSLYLEPRLSRPCMHACMQSLQSCLTLCNFMHHSPPHSSVHSSPGKNTGVGFHALLEEIFLTQGSNPHLLCLLTSLMSGGFFTTSTTCWEAHLEHNGH